MLRVGITGGIGSGKTTVCSIFESLGIAVFYADTETKQLYSNQPELRKGLQSLFGEEIFKDGNPDLKEIGRRVFSNSVLLEKLNALVHPFVFDRYESWCNARKGDVYTVKEAAILFESGSNKHVHTVIGVVAPLDVRIQRIMNRDGADEKSIREKIALQLPQEKLEKLCDHIVINDGVHSIVEQVLKLHRLFLQVGTNPI